jgi:hypothetical protein
MPYGFWRTILALAAALAGGAAVADPPQPVRLVTKSYPVAEFADVVWLRATPPRVPPVPPATVPPMPVQAVLPATVPPMPVQAVLPAPVPARPVPPAVRRSADSLTKVLMATVNPGSWAESGGPGTVRFDEASCSLVVTHTADVHAHVVEMLAGMRAMREKTTPPQVVVAPTVVEVPADFPERAGLALDLSEIDAAKRVAFLSAEQARALMECVQRERDDGKVHVLARPQMVTTDSQAAFFQVGQNVAVPIGLEQTDGPNGVEQKPQLQTVHTGMTIRATPQVSADRKHVKLRMDYEHAQVNPSLVKLGAGLELPVVNVQQMQTMVALPDGGTAVLAGPVVKSDGQEKRHHLIVVTANVVRQQPAECCPAAPAGCKSCPAAPAECKSCPAACEAAAAKPATCPSCPAARPPLVTKVFSVMDLVTPVPDFASGASRPAVAPLVAVVPRPVAAGRRTVRPEPTVTVLTKVPYLNQLLRAHCTTAAAPAEQEVIVLLTARVVGACGEKGAAVECCPAPPRPVAACGACCEAGPAAKLVAAYRQACADGRTEEAMRLALQALAADPMCFAGEK